MMPHVNKLCMAGAWAGLCLGISCSKPPLKAVTEINVLSATTVPSDPADAAWQNVPEYNAPLVLQDLVEPRQLTATTTAVRVRAISSGSETAFRLEWQDATLNEVLAASRFADACAVQLPQSVDANLPAPQMGDQGRAVDIAYWNAAHQLQANGGMRSIQDLYPNATVDHYPFQAASLAQSPASQQAMALRYAPAEAVGNPAAGHGATPMQDLIAEGPGTLTPAPATTSRGKGIRTAEGWAVVIVRTTPIAVNNARTHLALAVWDGAQEEAGARKMRTGWLPVVFQECRP